MQITLTPVRCNTPMTLSRAGDVLRIDGVDYDFTHLPEGATLPRAAVDCPWLASDIERVGGALHLTLILPHDATAPPGTLFPAPVVDPPDGPVALPPFCAPVTRDDPDGD